MRSVKVPLHVKGVESDAIAIISWCCSMLRVSKGRSDSDGVAMFQSKFSYQILEINSNGGRSCYEGGVYTVRAKLLL